MIFMPRYSVNKLGKLILDYLYNNSDTAKIGISNQIIDGEDLIEGLEDIYGDIQKRLKEGSEYEDDLTSIVNNLERIIGTKEGKIPNEIREIIKIYSNK